MYIFSGQNQLRLFFYFFLFTFSFFYCDKGFLKRQRRRGSAVGVRWSYLVDGEKAVGNEESKRTDDYDGSGKVVQTGVAL